MLFKAETAGVFGGEGCQGDKDGEDRLPQLQSAVVGVHHIDRTWLTYTFYQMGGSAARL